MLEKFDLPDARIIFCDQIFSSSEGGDDRGQSLRYLAANFLPNNTIETAYRSDRTWRGG